MLVLVLILVVIALVLLLAGWFLGVVALAWTSVGISLLAGLVLIYDWWQTRSAVRAGDRSEGAVDAGGRDGLQALYGSDMEPATQVLPVVRTGADGAPGAGAPVPGEPGNATDATVQMPAVRPSGSQEGPPGVSRSSGLSSPSVTDEAVPARAGTGDEQPAGTVAGGVGGQDAGTGRGGDPDRSGPPSAPGASGPDGSAPVAGSSGVGPRDSGTAPGSGTADAAPTGAVAAGAAGVAAAGAATGSRTDDPAGEPDPGSSAGAGDPAVVATGGPASDGAPTSAVGTSGEPAGADDTTAVPAEQAGEQQAGAPDDGEGPEEPHDATLAGLVARLPDEVLVVDEHPRYHVPACRALSGRPVIPLPVSEAVELGFTPCGWCSPNRALGERHPAQVR